MSGSSSPHNENFAQRTQTIPEKQMPEWARVASQAHKRATKKKRAELRQRCLPMIIWKDGKVREVPA
jgi:hypothetical protein